MCHQSVGLIARALEESGTPSLSLTSAWTITASANPPRAAYVDHPLGHTAGRPNDLDGQLAIARAAMQAFETITESGTIVALDSRWDTEWREDARRLEDHRSERFDTPQYQNAADRDAAVANHGDDVACSVCAPAEVPVD